MKLNIGSGQAQLEGYENIDRAFGGEAYPLSYPDDSIEAIRASHILEHFGYAEIDAVLQEWVRVLQPGGVLEVSVPDVEKCDRCDPMWHLYLMGGQTDANDFHKSAWTLTRLHQSLEAAGLERIEKWPGDPRDTSCHPVSANLRGYKPGVSPETRDVIYVRNIHAVMSMPRIAFTANMYCAQNVFGQRQIPVTVHTGAFWGQCLERSMEAVIANGAEYIFCIDYDSIYDGATVDRLIYLIHTHPEADAIAPWQIRREGDYPLVWITDAEGKPDNRVNRAQLKDPLLRVKHAHFGLTVFRVSSLLRLEHPWFMGIPNEDGHWHEGRTDDDIYFWEKWSNTGNTIYMANEVSIGHLQQIATWPTPDLGVAYQYYNDWQANGKPLEAW